MKTALLPRRVLTPAGFEEGRCLLITDGQIAAILPATDCPAVMNSISCMASSMACRRRSSGV